MFSSWFSVEHVLNLVSILYYGKICLNQKEPIKELFRANLSQLFTFLSYSNWLAVLGKMVNIVATFAWNYMDLFVMMISLGLSSRFKQINEDLQRVKGEVILCSMMIFILLFLFENQDH